MPLGLIIVGPLPATREIHPPRSEVALDQVGTENLKFSTFPFLPSVLIKKSVNFF